MYTHEDAITDLAEARNEVHRMLAENGYEVSAEDLRAAIAAMEADGNRLLTLSKFMSSRLNAAEDREKNTGPRY
jgi:Ca2+-binding EF-hand superfamily protein